jgi:hypothetical protein
MSAYEKGVVRLESSLQLVRATSFQPAVVRSRKASKASGCASSSEKAFTICDHIWASASIPNTLSVRGSSASRTSLSGR